MRNYIGVWLDENIYAVHSFVQNSMCKLSPFFFGIFGMYYSGVDEGKSSKGI